MYSFKKPELFLIQPWKGSKDWIYCLSDTAKIQFSGYWTWSSMGEWWQEKQARWALLLHKLIIQKELPGHSTERWTEAKPSAPSVKEELGALRDMGNSMRDRGKTPEIWTEFLLSIHQSTEHYRCLRRNSPRPRKEPPEGSRESRSPTSAKQKNKKETIPRHNMMQAAHNQWYGENRKAALEKKQAVLKEQR